MLYLQSLTAAGYVCYLSSVHRIVSDSPRLPFREQLLTLSPNMLTCVLMVAFTLTVILKAYVISIVWLCYKYLVMRQHTMHSMLPYIIPDVSPRQVGYAKYNAVVLYTKKNTQTNNP